MVDVQLEIINLSTGQSVGEFSLTICEAKLYELDLGSYRFRTTYLLTGEVLESNASITEGENLPLTFTFQPTPPPLLYTLTINTTTGGTTIPELGVYNYEAGAIVTVTAIPNEGYIFKRFELDGEVKMQNPINVGMDVDHTLLTVFEPATPPISPIPLVLLLLAIFGGVGVAVVTRKRR